MFCAVMWAIIAAIFAALWGDNLRKLRQARRELESMRRAERLRRRRAEIAAGYQ